MIKIIIYIFDVLIQGYQKLISPLLGPRCRYFPSCSEYAKICLHKYPLLKAFQKTIWRLLRCNPLSSGGIDHP